MDKTQRGGLGPLVRKVLGGGCQPLLVLPTRGRIYLHPQRTYNARWRCIGTHDVITTARFLARAESAESGSLES